jgi:hypothetical protein
VVQRVLEETLNYKKESGRYDTSEVRPILDEVPLEFAHETLKAARRIADDRQRTTTLAALVPYFPKELVPSGLEILREANDDAASPLVTLGPRLSDPLLSEAVAIASRITDHRARVIAMTGLAALLPNERRRSVLIREFRRIKEFEPNHIKGEGVKQLSRGEKVEALAILAPHLHEPYRIEACRTALEVVRYMVRHNHGFYGRNGFRALAPQLPQELLAEALAIATSNTHDSLPGALLEARNCSGLVAARRPVDRGRLLV